MTQMLQLLDRDGPDLQPGQTEPNQNASEVNKLALHIPLTLNMYGPLFSDKRDLLK